MTAQHRAPDPVKLARARAREAEVRGVERALYGDEKPATPPSGLGRPTLDDTHLTPRPYAPHATGHRPLPPKPPTATELAETMGQMAGTVVALQAQLRGRIVECDRWAHHLQREGNQAQADVYGAEAQGLRWGLGAVDRILAAIHGEKRPDRLALPDALPGMLPDGVA